MSKKIQNKMYKSPQEIEEEKRISRGEVLKCPRYGHLNDVEYLDEDDPHCENCGHMLYGSNTHIDYAYRGNNSAIY